MGCPTWAAEPHYIMYYVSFMQLYPSQYINYTYYYLHNFIIFIFFFIITLIYLFHFD